MNLAREKNKSVITKIYHEKILAPKEDEELKATIKDMNPRCDCHSCREHEKWKESLNFHQDGYF